MEVGGMTEELRYERRMSDSDALMWGIEKDPLLRSTIVAIALLDGPPDRARLLPDAPEPEDLGPLELVTDALGHEARRQLGIAKRMVGRVGQVVTDPLGSARSVADLVASAGRVMAPVFQPMSPLMANRSMSVRFDTITAPLSETKAAAKAADGKLNEAFVAAAVGGLRRYHDGHCHDSESLRMVIPINNGRIDTPEIAGNQCV